MAQSLEPSPAQPSPAKSQDLTSTELMQNASANATPAGLSKRPRYRQPTSREAVQRRRRRQKEHVHGCGFHMRVSPLFTAPFSQPPFHKDVRRSLPIAAHVYICTSLYMHMSIYAIDARSPPPLASRVAMGSAGETRPQCQGSHLRWDDV